MFYANRALNSSIFDSFNLIDSEIYSVVNLKTYYVVSDKTGIHKQSNILFYQQF